MSQDTGLIRAVFRDWNPLIIPEGVESEFKLLGSVGMEELVAPKTF